jgi:hypothetical protein
MLAAGIPKDSTSVALFSQHHQFHLSQRFAAETCFMPGTSSIGSIQGHVQAQRPSLYALGWQPMSLKTARAAVENVPPG